MALTGTIIKNGSTLAIECTSPLFNEPKATRHVWEIAHYHVSGASWRGADEAIGKQATISDGRITCYLGNGSRLDGTLANGGATEAVAVETVDIPPPKVRNGTGIRYRSGRWEKYSKKDGWIAV